MFEELDELIRRQIEYDRLPGLAVALVKGDGIVWSRGYGSADLETKVPFTPATVFSAQSVTKPVLATALMQWHERGRFQLDEPANDYLAPVRLVDERGQPSPATVRQLLTHTAGLPVDVGAASPADGGPKTLEEFVDSVAKTVRLPGEEIVYANYGYDVIGYLLERFAGQPVGEYLRERVLEPLGMQASAFGWPPEGLPEATGYFLSAIDGKHYGMEPDYRLLSLNRPAGSLWSTAEDLARFLIAHLNSGLYQGRRILEADTVSQMQRLHAPVGASQGGMGLGFRVDRVDGHRRICHGGDGPGATIFVAAYPDEKVGVTLMINLARANTARSVIGSAALRLLAGERLQPEPTPLTSLDDSSQLTGSYRSNFWGYDAVLRADGGALALTVEGGPLSGDGTDISSLEPVSEGAFRAHGGFFAGSDLTFAYCDDGLAKSFSGGVYPWRFDRTGDVPAPIVVDERADVAGRWTGTASSPLGPMPVAVTIADAQSASVTALSAHDAPAEAFLAEGGLVSGEFDVEVPGLGAFRVFLRLSAGGGKLRGKAYARGAFGEVAMPAELAKE